MAGLAISSRLFVGLNVCEQHKSLARSAKFAFMICGPSRTEICLAALFQIASKTEFGSINFSHLFHNKIIVDCASTSISFTVALIHSHILFI